MTRRKTGGTEGAEGADGVAGWINGSPADVASRSCAGRESAWRCWSLLVGEEIEKLGSDPIIMTPDNPSRSHLLEILGQNILSLIPICRISALY